MMGHERRTRILDMIREEGTARVASLSELFKVSEVTIRQDLDKLSAEGLVTREHGGAFLNSVPDQVRSLSLQHSENMDAKAKIGAAAAAMVNDGDRIILDSGSTTTEIAKCLTATDLTVITNALNIVLLLGSQPGIEVMATGGEFKPPTLSLTGDKAAAFFAGVNVDKVFLATAGVDVDAGLSYPGFSDIAVKRAMVEAAAEVVLVADSSKIGKRSLATLGGVHMVTTLVTDSGISGDTREAFEKAGVRVVTA